MEFDTKLLAKLLIDGGAQVVIQGGEDWARQADDRCRRALQEIRAALDDDTLEDPECFQRIERIVEIYETLGLSGGFRHDC